MRGWVRPVDGGLASDFGASRPGGKVHRGVDYFAPAGSPVRAPFAGMAVPFWRPAWGRSVLLVGTRGHALCAHLGAYGALGPVRAGATIGAVGHSGDAAGDLPHLHLEWHPAYGAAADPTGELGS